ncbi:putative tricarboxylic transport membrane protein [Nonomuraea solani]|uniref:Putative tricarboxylic transport membrane protein n=1 Tax=Nonomuraea solani TaxID=1144553 RepID=A0A1H5YEQ5_9ACTN|nr:tripartite tricarboxylate transporter substrate-binding protein [Nonomuraea solani]SEG22222.1 putative tricarboxylic transport membrane protein [Nonomuraea solani]
MRRRRFLAWGAGVAACAAGCGTERVTGAPRTRFSISPGGRRWTRVGEAFAGAARAAGFATASSGATAMSTAMSTAITVTGLAALSAAELNNGQTLLDTATPLARLSGDVAVVIVPGGSRFKDFADFGAHLLADPGRTLLAGGPQGEPDHLLFGLIAKGLGADARQVVYTGYPTSGEAAAALLSGKAAAAAGLFADWREHLGKGRVRALAVSSAGRVPGLDVPTLLESGVRVDFSDWVAAFGPDDMSDESREQAVRMCDEVLGSPGWHAACLAAGWLTIPLAGDDFARWLGSEIERTGAVLRDLGLIDSTKATTCWGSCGNGH